MLENMYIHCEGGSGKRLYKFDMISRDTTKYFDGILVLAHSSYQSFCCRVNNTFN